MAVAAVLTLTLCAPQAPAAARFTETAARHYIGVSLQEEMRDGYISGWRIGDCFRKGPHRVKCWVTEYGVWEFVPGEDPPGYSTVYLGLTATRWPCWVRLTLDYTRPAAFAAYRRC